jgi:hypothetical protein
VWTFLYAFATGEIGICTAAWFRQQREWNASIDGTQLKEKALHIATHVGIANFSTSSSTDNLQI